MGENGCTAKFEFGEELKVRGSIGDWDYNPVDHSNYCDLRCREIGQVCLDFVEAEEIDTTIIKMVALYITRSQVIGGRVKIKARSNSSLGRHYDTLTKRCLQGFDNFEFELV